MGRPAKREEMVKLTISIPKDVRKEAKKAAAEMEVGVGVLITLLIRNHTASYEQNPGGLGRSVLAETVPVPVEQYPGASVSMPKHKPKRQKDLTPRPPSIEWLERQLETLGKKVPDLARHLEITPNAIYEWQRKRVIPDGQISKIHEFLKGTAQPSKTTSSSRGTHRSRQSGTSWKDLMARMKAINFKLADLANHIEVPIATVMGWEQTGKIPTEYVGPIDRILTELE